MPTQLLPAIRRLGGGLVLIILVSGAIHLSAAPAAPPGDLSPAATAVRSLTEGDTTDVGLPTDFAVVMGYEPRYLPDVAPVRGDGDCSNPFGVGPEVFGTACRRHDLGYDLLRYAELTGEQLGPWARIQIDRRFAADMDSVCDEPACVAAASLYNLAVTVNSIRQGFGAPMAEPVLSWALLFLAVAVSGWTGPHLVRRWVN
ncbi:MAG TPA: hypothetical protein VJ938_00090 [Acidimicrobiia bacterium]|nr:hypothetical protein [Acidimicrobiia bacterium]